MNTSNYNLFIVLQNLILLGLKLYGWYTCRTTVIVVSCVDSASDLIYQLINYVATKYEKHHFLKAASLLMILTQLVSYWPLYVEVKDVNKSVVKEGYEVVDIVISIFVFQLVLKILSYIIGKSNSENTDVANLVADQLFDIVTTVVSLLSIAVIFTVRHSVSVLIDYIVSVSLICYSVWYWVGVWYKFKGMVQDVPDRSDIFDLPYGTNITRVLPEI